MSQMGNGCGTVGRAVASNDGDQSSSTVSSKNFGTAFLLKSFEKNENWAVNGPIFS